jgi:hypothetical protein
MRKYLQQRSVARRRQSELFELAQPRGMSAIGPKQTSVFAPHMSAFGGKADMAYCIANVRF